jgi:organic radical activating enzyme
MKPTIPFLETMITQVCNLSCEGCTNYSDLNHKGYVKWEDGKQDIAKWLNVVDIPDFGIMGGEPLINPEVYDWLYGIRELMPSSQLRFTTNGLLLHKHPDIMKTMLDIGNIVFKITAHTNDSRTKLGIKNIFNQYKWEVVTEFGITRWKTDNNVRFQVNYPTTFTKSFQNAYEDMMPFHSVPIKAYDICCQQTCPLLYNGKIYKCSTAGLLKDTLARFNNPNIDEWEDYIDNGVSPTDDIVPFLNNFGKPSALCGQCPTKEDTAYILDHLSTVTAK